MFIHESANWPHFTWDKDKISSLDRKALMHLGYLGGRMAAIGLDNRLKAMVETVTNDIVASSGIEGVNLDTDEVRSSVARKLGVDIPDTKEPTHFIDGIVEMMLDAIGNHRDPLTEERLFAWHRTLFPTGYSGLSPIRAGQYRVDEMTVVSGNFGRERIHYRAPKPDVVEAEMNSFISWLNIHDDSISAIVRAAIAHLWFVSIHPFDDGNGRMARAISDMVLAELDGDKLHFYSLSRQILKDRKHYYRVLESTQRGNVDITEWLEWFIGAHIQAVQDSDAMLSQVLRKATFWNVHAQCSISERQRGVLNIYLDGYDAKLTVKNWARQAGVSVDTASRDIADLVSKGILTPTPGRRRDIPYSINYTVADGQPLPFSEITIDESGKGPFISAIYKNGQTVCDKLITNDLARYKEHEVSLADLASKYFAYLLQN